MDYTGETENFFVREERVPSLEEISDKAKRTVKDSVFTNLFSDKKYVLEMYQALFPNETGVTQDDIETVTLSHDLINDYYNDLGFLVQDSLIILVEAQSQWSDNILVRFFIYIAQSWKRYLDGRSDMDIHSTRKVVLPKPKLFVIYTGDKKDLSDVVTLAKDFFDDEDFPLDIKVNVIRDGKKGDIINQYVSFTRVLAEQEKIYGKTRKAVLETIKICKDRNILKEYLEKKETEVVGMMMALYDIDVVLDKRMKFERYQGKQQGLQQGKIDQTLSLYKRHKYDEDEILDELKNLGLSEDEARVLIEKNAPKEDAPVRKKSMKL